MQKPLHRGWLGDEAEALIVAVIVGVGVVRA
jgi:hypothetical protein